MVAGWAESTNENASQLVYHECGKWLKPIWEKLKEYLLKEELLHADKTYYQVFSSEKKKRIIGYFRQLNKRATRLDFFNMLSHVVVQCRKNFCKALKFFCIVIPMVSMPR